MAKYQYDLYVIKVNHLLKKYKCIISYSDIIYGKDIIKN